MLAYSVFEAPLNSNSPSIAVWLNKGAANGPTTKYAAAMAATLSDLRVFVRNRVRIDDSLSGPPFPTPRA
jgi:hypothetical protein